MHHFSAGGLYNGLILLIDDETGTYWDHITGEAVHGPRQGQQLEVFGVDLRSVEQALTLDPEMTVARSKPPFFGRLFGKFLHRHKIGKRGFIPPPFRKTMGKADARLPEGEQGLGVAERGRAVFYPSRRLAAPVEDVWGDRTLRVQLTPDKVPYAEFTDDAQRPFQLFTRWYGFSYTFPDCEIRPAL